MGKLVKVPGVSMAKLQAALESLKRDAVMYGTDPYYGRCYWLAKWRITKGTASDQAFRDRDDAMKVKTEPGFEVEDAALVSVAGGSDEAIFWSPDHSDRALIKNMAIAGPMLAKAVSGSWNAEAVFAYEAPGLSIDRLHGPKKVGDTFESESDARVFERFGTEGAIKHVHGIKGVRAPITMKVRASYRKSDGSIRITSTFKSSGSGKKIGEEAEMDMANVTSYSHKVLVPEGVPIYAIDEAEATRIADDIEGASVVENTDTEWPEGMLGEAAGEEPALETMLPWHGDPLVESF